MEENKIEEKEKEFIADKSEKLGDKTERTNLGEEELIKIRKEKIIKFFKTRYNWIVYIILAWIVWIAVRIRTRNLDRLRDITTGTWTLGPDLDPFLFLRWAKYIVENGTLYAVDTMRYVPFGFRTDSELLFHPYLMAWFHKIALFFGSESVTHSAVLYPVFMFALTVIAFFLFTRKIFLEREGVLKSNFIALVSSFFLTVFPIFLPRTIAGIPEKESAAFLFMFLAFYFFLGAWNAKKFKNGIFLAILAGASTAGMALIWGGYAFIFYTLFVATFIAFILGMFDKNKLYIYATWILSSFSLMFPFSSRYPIKSLLANYVVGVLFIVLVDFLIFNTNIKNYISKKFSKIPPRIMSLIVGIVLLVIISSIFFGLNYFPSQIKGIISNLSPTTSRIIQTVAENKPPFFVEWVGSFGPIFRGIPIVFWIFFIGSIYLFYRIIGILNKKERWVMTIAYIIFILALIFSRYSGNSTFNGINKASSTFLFSGFIIILGSMSYYYYQYFKRGEENKFKQIELGYIILFAFLFLSLIAARGAIRLVMMLVPPISIIVSFFVVVGLSEAKKLKDNIKRIITLIFVGIIVIGTIFSGYQFYKQINGEAAGYAPSVYTQQWQKAMAWVRENTQKDAVFGHWWDYGYWLQSIGERATVLDGGNAQGYWNHLMGRHALTGTNDRDAIEFLYAHNTTHFLIDSSDIGKYTAFSSIGSDAKYDRVSWLSTFSKDKNQIAETKNSTIFLYSGGTNLDEDIIHEENDTKIFLPGGKSGIGAILIERDASGKIIRNPIGIFIYQNQQYRLPLRYAYYNGQFFDFGSGYEAGIFILPVASENGVIEIDGALIYLSRRTVKSQLARLYLYNEDNPYFKLAHSEDDFVVAQIKAQNPNFGDFVFFQGLRGPIRIWEIDYPEDIEFKEEYISTKYPEELEIS